MESVRVVEYQDSTGKVYNSGYDKMGFNALEYEQKKIKR